MTLISCKNNENNYIIMVYSQKSVNLCLTIFFYLLSEIKFCQSRLC